ncbi:MAG TPA: hypothetical protein VFQ53_30625 [Kofleriaceae bacterium]|nr:hypothetical protein [Kofleriaceae bacterium]
MDAKTATAVRRVELARVQPAALAKSAPAELVPQIVGAPTGAIVVGVARPASGIGQIAAVAVIDQLSALHAFKVQSLDTIDRSAITHRAELVFDQFDIATPRRHLCKWFEGTLVGTLTITELATGRVVFTRTVTAEAARRAHFSSREEITDLLVQRAVADWIAAFRQSGALKPKRS